MVDRGDEESGINNPNIGKKPKKAARPPLPGAGDDRDKPDVPEPDTSPVRVLPAPERLPPPTRPPDRPAVVKPDSPSTTAEPGPSDEHRRDVDEELKSPEEIRAERNTQIRRKQARGDFSDPPVLDPNPSRFVSPFEPLDFVPVVGTARQARDLADDFDDQSNTQRAADSAALAASALADVLTVFGVGIAVKSVARSSKAVKVTTAASSSADELTGIAKTAERAGNPIAKYEVVAAGGDDFTHEIAKLANRTDDTARIDVVIDGSDESLRNLERVVDEINIHRSGKTRERVRQLTGSDKIDNRPHVVIEIDNNLSKAEVDELVRRVDRVRQQQPVQTRDPLEGGHAIVPGRESRIASITVRTLDRDAVSRLGLDELVEARINHQAKFDNRPRSVIEAEQQAKVQSDLAEQARKNPDLTGRELVDALNRGPGSGPAQRAHLESMRFNEVPADAVNETVVRLHPRALHKIGATDEAAGGIATILDEATDFQLRSGGVRGQTRSAKAPRAAVAAGVGAGDPLDEPDTTPISDPDIEIDLSPAGTELQDPVGELGETPGEEISDFTGDDDEPVPDLSDDAFGAADPGPEGPPIEFPDPPPGDDPTSDLDDDPALNPEPAPEVAPAPTGAGLGTSQITLTQGSPPPATPIVLAGKDSLEDRPLLPGEHVEAIQFRQGPVTKQANLARGSIRIVPESESRVPKDAPITDIRIVKLSRRPVRRRKVDLGAVVGVFGPTGAVTFEEDIGQRGVVRESERLGR